MNLFQKLFKKREGKYYNSIQEMPMRKWIELGKSGELKLVHLEGNFDPKTAFYIVTKLKDQIIDTFGITDITRQIIRKKIEIENLYYKLIIKNDLSQKTFIQIKEYELEKLLSQKTNAEQDYFNSVTLIIKEGLTNKNTETITVYEYYGAIKLLETWQKTKSQEVK
jgi:hypothetical protein